MSEPKLISPMLDGFAMGTPISDHDGVKCCPAMREDSDNKYIVKIISIPASQVQLDALLLTGAYEDPADAMDYFKELADGVEKEAQLLKKLSKLEGFLPYDSWQVEPMENNQLGYDIYLISSYKRSLERFMRRNPMTHLGTINLGLDICAALAIARRAGHIYVDLKPTNIFLSENKEYRIGDLGFLDMSNLKYTSLPAKYRSEYTAPELRDPLVTVNTTADTYALGMILYQIYNNGQLPEIDPESEEPLPTPVNADYEIAEIIGKACAPDPKDRYSDPMEMGQALVAYMQRNRVTDTPIVPPVVAPVAGEQETILEKNGSIYDESAPGEEDADDSAAEAISDETSAMLDQADQLIATPAFDEPEEMEEAEDPEEESDSEPSAFEAEEEDMDNEAFLSMGDAPEETPEEPPVPVEPKPEKKKRKKQKKTKKKKGFAAILITLVILGLLGGGGYYFYDQYYLQTVSGIDTQGQLDQLTVTLDTEIDNSLLTVVISDTYGNSKKSPVKNNTAAFTGLLPDTLYKIRIEISGFHALDPEGVTTHSYTTDPQTKIASFTAKTGSEDGSVVLNFAVEGPTCENWTISYAAGEGEVLTHEFSGSMTTITGLTVGETYTFTLTPAEELVLVGENTIEHTASNVILASGIKIASFVEGNLTMTWSAPEDTLVESWTVRCYSADGFDETITVSENSAFFTGIATGKAYTLEVTAAGMTQSATAGITADPYSVSNFQVDDSNNSRLTITWDDNGRSPADGWFLKYTIDNGGDFGVAQCDGNKAVIQPQIPGATYHFSLESADGNSVLGNTFTYTSPNAIVFIDEEIELSENDINYYLQVHTLVTPEDENWSYQTVGSNDYTSTFASGQKASILLHMGRDFWLPDRDMVVMYVIRDAEGNVLTDYVKQQTLNWRQMWDGNDYHYCELNVPAIPTKAGSYKLYLYFDHMAVTIAEFTVTE